MFGCESKQSYRPDRLVPMRSDVSFEQAAESEIGFLIALAGEDLPMTADENIVRRVLRHDPSSLRVFRKNDRIKGFAALLYLNAQGLQTLLAGTLDKRDPDMRALAKPDETPAATYIWALAVRGPAIAALGQATVVFRSERLAPGDLYASPSTQAGRRFLVKMDFTPVPTSGGEDLWHYRRPSRELLA